MDVEHREVQQLAQGGTASEPQSQDQNPASRTHASHAEAGLEPVGAEAQTEKPNTREGWAAT